VFQLICQFPTKFQFNTKLLLFLAHHVYSCKFGTFLGENDKSRFKEGTIKLMTTSIWTYVNDNIYDFINPFFIPSKKPLQPNCDYMALEFWKEHFLVWSEFSNYQPDLNLVSPDEHKEEIMKIVLEENLMMKKRIIQLEEELKKTQEELAKHS
jgi:hypothetical protein